MKENCYTKYHARLADLAKISVEDAAVFWHNDISLLGVLCPNLECRYYDGVSVPDSFIERYKIRLSTSEQFPLIDCKQGFCIIQEIGKKYEVSLINEIKNRIRFSRLSNRDFLIAQERRREENECSIQ